MTGLFQSPFWPFFGLALGVMSAVVVALIQRKPTEVQLGASAFEQLQELSSLYRSDLAEYRAQRAESLKVEQALRLDLDSARKEIAGLQRELELARGEVAMLRRAVASDFADRKEHRPEESN